MTEYERVEKAARAIYESEIAMGYALLIEWGAIDQDVRNAYLRMAQAAIDAMSAPEPEKERP